MISKRTGKMKRNLVLQRSLFLSVRFTLSWRTAKRKGECGG